MISGITTRPLVVSQYKFTSLDWFVVDSDLFPSQLLFHHWPGKRPPLACAICQKSSHPWLPLVMALRTVAAMEVKTRKAWYATSLVCVPSVLSVLTISTVCGYVEGDIPSSATTNMVLWFCVGRFDVCKSTISFMESPSAGSMESASWSEGDDWASGRLNS